MTTYLNNQAQDTQVQNTTQPRDWSEVVKKLYSRAWDYRHKTGYNYLDFNRDTLAILQEFDAQNQTVCAETAPTEVPIELVMGDTYQWTNQELDHHDNPILHVGKLVSSNSRGEFVMDTDSGFKIVGKGTFRKHTPKPVEHTFTREEIEQVLNTQQLQEPNAGNLCVRGKIIRQLLKELGENV